MDLAKIEYFVQDFIDCPYDLKMCASACGSPWTVSTEHKTGLELECYNMYIKPSYFGIRTRKQYIVVSVLFNSKNCKTTKPNVWLIDSDKAKKAISVHYPKSTGFWKGNAEKNWRYAIPKDLLQEVA